MNRNSVFYYYDNEDINSEEHINELDNIIIQNIDDQEENNYIINQENEMFFNLCNNNDLKKIKEIFNKSVHLNIKNIFGRTPLLIAIENNYIDLINYFISEGANIMERDNDGNNGIMITCRFNHYNLLKYLLSLNLINLNVVLEAVDNNNMTALLISSQEGHLEIIKYLIEDKNVSLNALNNRQENCLSIAVANNNLKVVRYLIQLNIDLENKNILEQTPLNIACVNGNLEIVNLLLKNECNYNSYDIKKNSCLINAVISNNIDIIEVLSSYCVEVNHVNEDGNTALLLACKNTTHNSYSIISYLIEYLDANLLMVDKNSNDLLMILSKYNNISVFKYVLSKMMDYGHDINRKNNDNDTVLLINTELNNQLYIELIIENGGNIRIKNDVNESCLSIAVSRGYYELSKFLINKFKNNILETTDNVKNNLLMIACKYNHTKLAKYLIKRGSKINRQNIDTGETALHYAVINNNLELTSLLVEKKADKDILDYNLNTSLMIASNRGYTSIMKYLIKNNADYNIKDIHDNNIIANEAKFKRYDNVKFIINRGGDPNTILNVSFNYKTLLINFVIEENINMIEFLLNKNANTELTDIDGNTALLYAFKSKNLEIIKLLLEHGSNIEHANFDGETCFGISIQLFDKDILNFLIDEYNFDINFIDENGKNILHLFITQYISKTLNYLIDPVDFIKFLIDKKININLLNSQNKTALIRLCNLSDTNEEIIKLLLSNNADVNLKENTGNTALTYAIGNCNYNLVKLLVEIGNADINVITNDLDTPLTIATIENSFEIIKYLVERGVNINSQNKFGNTALIISADHEDLEIVQYLYNKGSNIELQRVDGRKAYNMTDNEDILKIFGMKTNEQLLEEQNYEEFCNKNKIIVKKFDPDELLCVICKSEDINCISDCAHKFCAKCLLRWYIINKNCPICRKIVKEITFMKEHTFEENV